MYVANRVTAVAAAEGVTEAQTDAIKETHQTSGQAYAESFLHHLQPSTIGELIAASVLGIGAFVGLIYTVVKGARAFNAPEKDSKPGLETTSASNHSKSQDAAQKLITEQAGYMSPATYVTGAPADMAPGIAQKAQQASTEAAEQRNAALEAAAQQPQLVGSK